MIRITRIVSLAIFILSQSVECQSQLGKLFNRGDVCVLHDKSEGICENVRSCSWAKEQVLSKNMSLSQIVTCGFEKQELLVCCKQKLKSKKLFAMQTKSQIACEMIKKQTTIENGSTHLYSNVNLPVQPTEFPHMVALGFFNDNEQQYKYICSGTLITRSIVLTSARCVDGPPFPTIVTLGKVTLEQTLKLSGESQRHIGIENTTMHPDYTFGESYHDIALVRLLMPVTISSAIRPACLASIDSNLMKSSDQLASVGWGPFVHKNRNMTVLYIQKMEVIDRESCDFDFKVANFSEMSGGVKTGQFCAFVDGNVREPEICRIELPGGPIETNIKGVHYVTGVSSFRPFCSRILPEIFISIGEYLDWIESIVWPQDVSI